MSEIKQEKIPIDEKISIGVKIVEAIKHAMSGIEYTIMKEVEEATNSLIEKYPQYKDEILALENLASDKARDIESAAEQEYPSLSDLNIVEEDEDEEDFDDLDFLKENDSPDYIEE